MVMDYAGVVWSRPTNRKSPGPSLSTSDHPLAILCCAILSCIILEDYCFTSLGPSSLIFKRRIITLIHRAMRIKGEDTHLAPGSEETLPSLLVSHVTRAWQMVRPAPGCGCLRGSEPCPLPLAGPLC